MPTTTLPTGQMVVVVNKKKTSRNSKARKHLPLDVVDVVGSDNPMVPPSSSSSQSPSSLLFNEALIETLCSGTNQYPESIEIIISDSTSTNTNTNTSHTITDGGDSNHRKLNQLSIIMRRLKPPNAMKRRSLSSSSTASGVDNTQSGNQRDRSLSRSRRGRRKSRGHSLSPWMTQQRKKIIPSLSSSLSSSTSSSRNVKPTCAFEKDSIRHMQQQQQQNHPLQKAELNTFHNNNNNNNTGDIHHENDNLSKSPTTGTLLTTITTTTIDQSSTFFAKEDFDTSTWLEVNMTTNGISIFGAAVMTATVVIHPLVFVAGVGVSAWAVGVLHGLERGYQFFSDVSFSDLFWADSEEDTGKPVFRSNDEENAIEGRVPSSPQPISSSGVKRPLSVKTNRPQREMNDLSNPEKILPNNMIDLSRASKRHLTSTDNVIIQYFPPLDHHIVRDVKFPGLNSLEFFEVFFSDNAPYTFKDFQLTQGDIDIDFNNWENRTIQNEKYQHSFHPAVNHSNENFPSSSMKERELNFKTLTKSYFGPAYATARKTQRVTRFSTRLVIIESKTELFDIPFSDRFYVIERWVVEADKDNNLSTISNNGRQPKGPIYTAKLSASVQVFMLKTCKFEKQIEQKTLSTVKAQLKAWTEKATQALDLALQKKLEKHNFRNYADTNSLITYRTESKLFPPKQERALQLHREKLRVIEENLSSGNYEYEGVGSEAAFDDDILNSKRLFRPTEITLHRSSKKSQKNRVLRVLKLKKK